MGKLKIKKGDTVRVITGKDKGKEGKVLVVDMKNERVIVEGVNMATKHMKPRVVSFIRKLRSMFLTLCTFMTANPLVWALSLKSRP